MDEPLCSLVIVSLSARVYLEVATLKKNQSIMVSFQRMKDEIDGWGNHISSRVPVVSKTACLTLTAVGVFLLFIIGFAIGYGSHRVAKANSQAL